MLSRAGRRNFSNGMLVPGRDTGRRWEEHRAGASRVAIRSGGWASGGRMSGDRQGRGGVSGAVQGLPVRGGAFDVLAGAAVDVPRLLVRDLADSFGGEADYEAAGRELTILRDDGAGGDDGARAYLGAVENGCAHPDQAPVPHLAAVDDGVVPDHAPLADYGGETGVCVQHAAVLDVRPRA